MKRLILYCAFLLMISPLSLYAQDMIKGSVKSASGEALIGASVLVKGTSQGTVVDIDGNFQLAVDQAAKASSLVISFIGYKTVELTIGERTEFNVVLEEDQTTLTEVVVTGYTAQSKEKITGAISTVSEELITRLPVPSLDQALQGRAPGVFVSQNTGAPGEGVSVRIRGVGSINSGNSPLYIVDGIPTLDMTGFSTQDIASISVLKDASAAAVYGSRAANGVVIVTTKQGKSAEPRVQINMQYGVQEPSRLIDMTNNAEYTNIYNEAANNDNATKTNPIFFRDLITDDVLAKADDVDYIDAIMHRGVLQSHSISLSGGESKTQYFVALNYFDQEGIVKSSAFSRVSGRVNVNSQVKDWLRMGVNMNIARGNTNVIGSSGDGAGGNGGSVIRYAFFRTPAIPIYDDDGNFTDLPERFDLYGDGYSPVGMLAYNNNERVVNQAFGKIFVDLTPFEGFKFTSNFGLDISHLNQRRFDRNWGTGNRINNPNQLFVQSTRHQALTFSNFATYEKDFGEHHFNFLLGTEAIKTDDYGLFGNGRNFPDQDPILVFLGNDLGIANNEESKSGSSLLSFFGKVDYDLKEKYLLSVTGRRDGSSKFGPENRWGNFYAGSAGWRVDREDFLMDNSFIDKLFLRVGYGSIGNQEIDNYAFTDRMGSDFNYPFGNARAVGYAVTRLGNSRIKWESSNQLNAGLDLTLLNGKLDFSFDYFKKTTVDLLVQGSIASSAGKALPPWVNNGKIRNRGFEVSITYANQVGDFNYSVNLNGATLYNEVLDVNAPITGGAIGSDKITLTEVGHPIGSFYMLEMEGIFQDEGQIFTHAIQGSQGSIHPGDVMFRDADTSGAIDGNDRVHSGSAIPNLTAGLNVSLNYKHFDFSLFFQGAYGQKIFSVLNRDIEGFYRAFNVTQRYYDNHWTGPGTSNEFPRASWDASGNNNKFSTRFLDDGSYTRLKNLQLGYTLPGSMLEKLHLVSLRVYFSGTNLLTFTKFPGMDPEMTTSDNAKGERDRGAGMDWGTYPSAKSYNMGVTLTF